MHDKPVWTFAAIIERSGLMVSSVLKLASTIARRASVRAGNREGSYRSVCKTKRNLRTIPILWYLCLTLKRL